MANNIAIKTLEDLRHSLLDPIDPDDQAAYEKRLFDQNQLVEKAVQSGDVKAATEARSLQRHFANLGSKYGFGDHPEIGLDPFAPNANPDGPKSLEEAGFNPDGTPIGPTPTGPTPTGPTLTGPTPTGPEPTGPEPV